MSELVTCKDLTKRFGNHTALDHLNPVSYTHLFPMYMQNLAGNAPARQVRSSASSSCVPIALP